MLHFNTKDKIWQTSSQKNIWLSSVSDKWYVTVLKGINSIALLCLHKINVNRHLLVLIGYNIFYYFIDNPPVFQYFRGIFFEQQIICFCFFLSNIIVVFYYLIYLLHLVLMATLVYFTLNLSCFIITLCVFNFYLFC